MYEGDTKEFNLTEESTESVNEIVEIKDEVFEDPTPDNKDLQKEEKPIKKKRKKISKIISDFWHGLSKKGKIITISIIAVVILAIIIISIILINHKKEDANTPDIILEADNYRYENGNLFFLNKDGEEIGSYSCSNKDEKLCYVAYISDEDDFDISKNMYNDDSNVLKRMNIIDDNYVFIYDNKEENDGLIVLYSIKENASYDSYKLVKAYDTKDNYVILKDEHNNYGMLLFENKSFSEKISFKYNYLGFITEGKDNNNYIVCQKNNKWYLIDYNEKEITKAFNYEIKNYNNLLVSAKDDEGIYALYDFKGNKITKEDYEYINFFKDYVLLIKDKYLYMMDSALNPLYAEGIKLSDTYYNKINVYDKKTNKYIETKEAFSLSLNNNTIELNYKTLNNSESKLINIFDSEVSKNYEYISYYDGKLYIYRDSDKTNLLGSYTCTNKNNITSGDSSLTNCYIATSTQYSDNELNVKADGIYYLPIFNNRFIFIKDTPALSSEETMNIVLYDLSTNKSLGTYRSIDALDYNKNSTVSFVEATGALVIAKNSKDYFGILKINLSEISSLENIKFNDKNKYIEKIGDYFEIQKSSGTYYLADQSGKSVTSEFSGKIVSYKGNYLKVKSGSTYKVFTFDGSEISNKSFDYVELLNNGFVGVINNTLNIYRYNNSEKVYDQDLALNITSDYSRGKSFIVQENGSVYIVKVYNTNGDVAEYNSLQTNLGDTNETE